jgi:hypothetical protein
MLELMRRIRRTIGSKLRPRPCGGRGVATPPTCTQTGQLESLQLFMEAADKTEREELQWMRSNMTTSEQKTKLIKPLREQQKPVSEKAETHSSLSVRQFGTGESQITANAGQVQPKEGTHLSIAGAQPRPESLRHNTNKFVWNIN